MNDNFQTTFPIEVVIPNELLIETKYPIIVVRHQSEHGRYLWYGIDKHFDISGNAHINQEGVWIKGEYYCTGHYRNYLPGERDPEGWEFAFRLYDGLKKLLPRIDFTVSIPRWYGNSSWSVTLQLKPKWLHQAVMRHFGLLRTGEILAKRATSAFADEIVNFIREQKIGCNVCGKPLESALLEKNQKYCLEHLFKQFGLDVPQFRVRRFGEAMDAGEKWDFEFLRGGGYHLYAGNIDACRLYAAIFQPGDLPTMFNDIEYVPGGALDVVKHCRDTGSRFVIVFGEHYVQPEGFYVEASKVPRFGLTRYEDINFKALVDAWLLDEMDDEKEEEDEE